MKNLMHYEIFLLVQQDILLSGKCTERAMYVFIARNNLVLNFSEFLCTKTAGILTGVPCVDHHSDDRVFKFH
jgi:hypothetical protein